MSILIKGMEMPKSCEDCDLCTSDGYCIATGGDSLWDALPEGAEYFPTGWKYEGCPVIEVPAPHRRIADMDEAIKCIEEVTGKDAEFAISLIEWACGKRTIIEAEEDGE